MNKRFQKWVKPVIEHGKLTKWNWMVQYNQNLKLGNGVDIGAFCYLNCKFGITIEDDVQIGSHSSLYSHNSIENRCGRIILKKNCKIGSHCTIMPGVTIGENSIVGAHSFVNCDVPKGELWFGVPAKFIKKLN